MTTWPNLALNEQVTHDEVQWAIANNYLAIRPGQVADIGNECISSVQAIGWLFIDSNYMPPLDRGELPVKGNFSPLPTSLRLVLDETYTPRIDINLFVSIDDITLENPSGNFDQTYSVKGGSILAAVCQSLETSSATNAKKHLRISKDSEVFVDTSNPNLDSNIIWSGRISSGSSYLIEAFGSADSATTPPPTDPPTADPVIKSIHFSIDTGDSGVDAVNSIMYMQIYDQSNNELLLDVRVPQSGFSNIPLYVVDDSNGLKFVFTYSGPGADRKNLIRMYAKGNSNNFAGLNIKPGNTITFNNIPKLGNSTIGNNDGSLSITFMFNVQW